MSSRFYFSPSDSGSDLDNDDTTLPFPKPLDRSSFLTPDFDATEFLSSLSNRFQTLEDLQTELRELNSTLNKELIDLVNDNYQDFLSLGATLAGGEEKIQDIRVGVLGFQRDVSGVKELVERRREEVKELLQQKRAIRSEIGIGRALLEIAERLEMLEGKLGLGHSETKVVPTKTEDGQDSINSQWSVEWLDEPPPNESDDEYDSDEATSIPPRLRRRAEEFLILKLLVSRHSPQHPFISAVEGRVRKLQEIILTDLDVAIRREPEVKAKQQMLQLRAAVAE